MVMKKQHKYFVIIVTIIVVMLAVDIIKKENKIIQVSNEKTHVNNEVQDNNEESEYDRFIQSKFNEKIILEGDNENESYMQNSIDLGAGVIVLENNNYITKLNEINRSIDNYVGRKISYEGFVYKIVNEQNEESYVVARYYEQEHNRIFHTTVMGLKGGYNGQWPAVDTWVKVEGMIGKAEFNGQELPAVIIENLTVMDTEGQRRVYN